MKKNGDFYHVKLKIANMNTVMNERIYGKNQVVEAIDENHTKVSVDMQNEESILVFILGFNKNLDVIEPNWLKEKLLDYSSFLKEKYGHD